MGWIDESGRHEAFVAFVFADGKLGSSAGGKRMILLDRPGGPLGADATESRPPEAVIGWRVACDHIPPTESGTSGRRSETWLSPVVWHRVYAAADEDLDQRRIHAPLSDPTSVDVVGHNTVLDELLQAEWRHHIEPADHARSIRNALDNLAKARQLLDLDVAVAHGAGMSWADIGRVAGITRQAARDRWGKRLDGRNAP